MSSAAISFGNPFGTPSMGVADVTPTLYRDLHRLAARHLSGERRNHTLRPTALVNEAYLKLASGSEQRFANDVHFLAVASRVMRQVLVDYARSRATKKRSAESKNEFAVAVQNGGGEGPGLSDLIALDDALAALAMENRRVAQAIEMRYFGGMTAEDTAEALGVSVHAVRHDLRFGQAWLRRKLGS